MRDKIAASKRKGLWVGGPVPLGYAAVQKKSWSSRPRPRRFARSLRAIWRWARDPAIASGIGQFGVIQAMAPSLRVEVTQVNLRDDVGEIGRAVAAFAVAPNGGLIVTASPLSDANRDLIATLAAQHKLPAVYYERNFVAAGGLISYGPDFVDQFRRAAEYVDRILKGEKPADPAGGGPDQI